MLTPVPPGEIATVVTHLVQDAPPLPGPASALGLAPWPRPPLDQYRDLFAAVGAPWLWYSRLLMTDRALDAVLCDPEVHVLRITDGAPVGFVEIDAREAPLRIAFFGLVPEQTGRGHGGGLLAAACAYAWALPGTTAVRVNTCTLDHPAALPNYLRAGFRVVGRSVETFPDPRLSGVLPPDAAPHAPAVAPDSWR